jgi:hypothetical protein
MVGAVRAEGEFLDRGGWFVGLFGWLHRVVTHRYGRRANEQRCLSESRSR